MSKKTRRYRTPNLPTSAYSAPSAPAVSAAPVTATPAPARRTQTTPAVNLNWQDEYHEVFGDLKRTGVIAVVLLAAMGVLSFFIR